MENQDPRHLLVSIARILERLNIPYLITGGLAVVVWGRPRFTADIDIVVELKKRNLNELERALRRLTPIGSIDTQMMQEAFERQEEFNVVDHTSGMKVDFWILKKTAFDRSRLKRRVAKKILNTRLFFISPEDLLLTKLSWYKESESTRQLEDAGSILAISGKKLDRAYVKRWARWLKVSRSLNKLLKKHNLD